ncbi:hypothetical protein STANM309S_05624 [Streptomyces tanashiensis]
MTAGVDVTVRPTEDLEKVRAVIAEAGDAMAKEEPWRQRLWFGEALGSSEVLLDSMTIRVSVKTMPGKKLGVERELRWRIKRGLDEAGIRIVGGLPPQAEESQRIRRPAWWPRRCSPRRPRRSPRRPRCRSRTSPSSSGGPREPLPPSLRAPPAGNALVAFGGVSRSRVLTPR